MRRILVISGLLFGIACAPQLKAPTALDAQRASYRWPHYSIKHLAEGHQLYIIKCSSCHSLYKPTDFTEEKWNKLYPEMSMEARLDSAQHHLILNYLVVMSDTIP